MIYTRQQAQLASLGHLATPEELEVTFGPANNLGWAARHFLDLAAPLLDDTPHGRLPPMLSLHLICATCAQRCGGTWPKGEEWRRGECPVCLHPDKLLNTPSSYGLRTYSSGVMEPVLPINHVGEDDNDQRDAA